ncbi:hypothetical protein OSB04_028044 [Centaurea solstitialis]|uniref:NADP-dependent oxidoreductase domain-containing protein n=1 Tax=Centaurea solstitialis TaxID=347529 RepID=A0AA38SZV3_9ASTR|nr:hypothetical protein OSB04_028044 [Centaurea solstitialis]
MAARVRSIKLGSQGMEVSALGLGCMGMSIGDGPDKTDQDMIKLIHHAVNSGVTLLDTADFYGPHANEILIGKALKGLERGSVQLATKFGIKSLEGEGEVRGDPEYVRACCEASLKRLDVDYIDLYYVHRIDSNVPIEITMGELKKLVEEGKIKYIGLSDASPSTIRRAHVIHPITAVQLEWSLWTRDMEQEVIPTCRELGIGIVPYSPLGSGFLALGPKLLEGSSDDDYRKYFPRFYGDNLDHNKILFERICELAEKKGCSPSQLALSWVLHQGTDVSPIPGTCKIKNLNQNIGSLSIKLLEEDMAELESIASIDAFKGDRLPPTILALSNVETPSLIMAGRVRRIKLGSQGMEVSAIGLGCLEMTAAYGPAKPEEDMIKLIHHAVNSGVTHLDTADFYGPHANEILIGKMGELKKLVDEGKIKYIGLSDASPSTIRRAHVIHPITAIQLEWSLWTRDMEQQVIPTCRELGIGIVPYSPLGSGFLAVGPKLVEGLADSDFRKLGSQGMEVSAIGLGCFEMTAGYGPAKPEEDMIKLIHHAVNSGVTHLDTADSYGPHANENLIGKALKGLERGNVQVATKFGMVALEGDIEVRGDPEYVRACCEASLKRLDVDYIDLYYVHRNDSNVPIEITMGEMKKLVDEGKIRYVGLSDASPSTIRRAHVIHPITALQLEWSLWTRDMEDEVIPTCRELGIGIVPYSPLGSGFLAVGPKLVEGLTDFDYRKYLPRLQANNLEYNKMLFERIRELAKKKGCTSSQLALSWVLHQGSDVSPIPGTSKIKNLDENVRALSIKLLAEEMTELASIVSVDTLKGNRLPPTILALSNVETPSLITCEIISGVCYVIIFEDDLG